MWEVHAFPKYLTIYEVKRFKCNANLNHSYFVPDYSFFSCVGKCVNKQMVGET